MRLSRTPRHLASLAALAALTTSVPLLGGCQSTTEGSNFSWHPIPTFREDSVKQGAIRVEWKNPVAEGRFNELEQTFVDAAQARGFTIAENLADADYIYCLSLRFFGVNPHADQARSVRNEAGDIRGGYNTWFVEGQGLDSKDRSITAIELEQVEKSRMGEIFGGGDEYCVLLDVAIGERRATPGSDEAMIVRREARLVGWVAGLVEDRDGAIEHLKTRIAENLSQLLP